MNGSFQSLTLLHYVTEETNNNKTMAKHKELRRVAYLSNLTRKLIFSSVASFGVKNNLPSLM